VRISVVIPTYNRYNQLQRALKSVFSQTFLPFEVIVVDDASNDETSKVQQNFPNIIYKKLPQNRGVSFSRNFGVSLAKGELIAFLDSDDEWEKTKLQKQLKLHKNENICMSYTAEEWIKDGNKINIPKKFQKIGKDIFLENLEYCNIAPSSVVITKRCFLKYSGFDTTLEVCEDYDLWLRVNEFSSVKLLNESLCKKYGGANDQLSTKYWGMDRFRVYALEKHLEVTKRKKEVLKIILKKLKLLCKGAKKHKKETLQYELKIEKYEKLYSATLLF